MGTGGVAASGRVTKRWHGWIPALQSHCQPPPFCPRWPTRPAGAFLLSPLSTDVLTAVQTCSSSCPSMSRSILLIHVQLPHAHRCADALSICGPRDSLDHLQPRDCCLLTEPSDILHGVVVPSHRCAPEAPLMLLLQPTRKAWATRLCLNHV